MSDARVARGADLTGSLLAVAMGVLFAFVVIFGKNLLHGEPPFTLLFFRFGVTALLLALVAVATLAANSASRLRFIAIAFLAISIAAHLFSGPSTSLPQLAVSTTAALVSAAVLFVAARDARYGEDPGWRLWLSTVVAAAATVAAFATLRTTATTDVQLALLGEDPSGITQQAAAFWLISSGIAILVTARGAVRGSLGALLMLTGSQLFVGLAPGPQLAFTLLLSWLEVVVALSGAFLVINERALREA